jgi:hypothetical protein
MKRIYLGIAFVSVVVLAFGLLVFLDKTIGGYAALIGGLFIHSSDGIKGTAAAWGQAEAVNRATDGGVRRFQSQAPCA